MFCKNCGHQLIDHSKFCPSCGTEILAATTHLHHTGTDSFEVTSIGIRFLNFFLDKIFWIIFYIILYFIGSLISDSFGKLLGLTSFITYYLLFEGVWQKTPAKWITKTKVVMHDGSKPDFMHILGRSFARLIPFEPLSFLAKPIGWHDSLSKTLVVPAHYDVTEVKHINLAAKGKTSTVVIVIICVVVGIMLLGLVSSVILLLLNSARTKSRDNTRIAQIAQIRSALELYHNDRETYPNNLNLLSPNYIDPLPIAPVPSDGSCTPEQNDYSYTLYNKDSYGLTFCLGNQSGKYPAGVKLLTPQGIIDPANINKIY